MKTKEKRFTVIPSDESAEEERYINTKEKNER